MNFLNLFLEPATWLSLITLTIMEIVLGIDNVIFISLVTSKLPKHEQNTNKIKQENWVCSLLYGKY